MILFNLNRKFLTEAALCVATLTGTFFMTGCTYEPSDKTAPEASQIIIASTDNTQTKTCIEATIGSSTSYVAVLWTPSDELGVFTDAESNIKYTKYDQTTNEAVASFVASETVTGTPQYAYYPYSETAGTDMTSLSGNIPEIQTMDPEAGTLPGDCKVGVYKETTSEGAQFKFTHLFSPVRIIINGASTDVSTDQLKGIDLTVTRDGEAVPLCGNFTYNAQTGAYTLGQTSNSVTFDWTTQPSLGSQAQAFGTIFSEIKKGDLMTFVIRTTSHTATVTVTAKVDFQTNTLYTFPLTLSNLTDNTVIENNDDSGSTEDSGTTEGTVTASGTFTAATYNVDGLPNLSLDLILYQFELNPDGPGSNGTTSIANKIAADDWDIIGFSEDFEYHSNLTSVLSSSFTFGKYRGTVTASAATTTADTDGLGFATRTGTCSFANETIVEFTSSAGGLTSGANTCIKKGFRHYEVTVAEGIIVDVIITHMNTYSSSGTDHINAQHAQLKQIAQYVNKIRSNNRPIIFMGDTNCRYTRHDFDTYFWSVLDSDLIVNDPWVDYQWGGVYPTYPSNSLMVSDATGTSDTDIICSTTQNGEVVDKIIYINNPDSDVQISANSYLRDYDGYNGMADHMPIVVEFTYEKTTATIAETQASVNAWADEELQ